MFVVANFQRDFFFFSFFDFFSNGRLEKKLIFEESMSKQLLIEAMKQWVRTQPKANVSDAFIGRFTDAVMKNAQELTLSQGRFTYPGLGSFTVRARAARQGRNPQTGEALHIPARNAIRFSAATRFKELAQEADVEVYETRSRVQASGNTAGEPPEASGETSSRGWF
jgi:DNA-binding protein HU-beta